MRDRATRLFNIYRGEERQVIFFFIFTFLLFFAIFLPYKISDTLFVAYLSTKNLPFAYGAIALTLILGAFIVIHAYNKYSPKTVFTRLLAGTCAAHLILCIASFLDVWSISPWSWFGLKIINQIIYIQTVSCFWTFMDQYYHFQDAKRIYALFNSAIYLGLTTSGLVIYSASWQLYEVFAASFCILVVALFLITFKTKQFITVPDDTEAAIVSDSGHMLRSFFSTLLKSKFALFLMSANLLSCLLLTTTEISYLSDFQTHFTPANTNVTQAQTEELSRFYGTCLAVAGIINLIFGWFLYSRAVVRFGITSIVLFSSLAFMSVFSGWYYSTSLLFPVLGLFMCESTVPALDENNFNVLLNAVPLRIKPKVRILIESFSEPSGMLISSLVISAAFIDSRLFGMLLSGLAVFVTWQLSRNYFNGIFQNLKNHALHLSKTMQDWFYDSSKRERRKSDDQLVHMCLQGDILLQKMALDVLFSCNKQPLIKKVLQHNPNFPTETKIHFIHLIDKTLTHPETYPEPLILDLLAKWQENETDIDLLGEIDFFLAKRALLHPDKAYNNLTSSHLRQKCAAIIALQNSFAPQSIQDLTYNKTASVEALQQLLESPSETELAAGLEVLGIEGLQQNIEVLIEYIYHPSITVARAAAKALLASVDNTDVRHGKNIIEAVKRRNDSEFRIYLLKTIAKIGSTTLIRPLITITPTLRPNELRVLEKVFCEMGLKTVPTLVSILNDVAIPDRQRLFAGKILAQLSLPQLKANLYQIIKTEIHRAYFYYAYANMLPNEYDGTDLTLLKDGLFSSFDSVISFIIQLLGASKWIEDAELISFSLRSKNPKIVSQAIETLEFCCNRKIFRLLYPLIADLPLKEKLRFCVKYTDTTLELPEMLKELEGKANTLELVLALTWMYRLDVPEWRTALRKHIITQEEAFHRFTYELLET